VVEGFSLKAFYKKYFYTIVVAGAVFLLSILFSLTIQEDSSANFQSILIEEGDTLWSIASRYEESHLTKAEFIAWIEEYNEVRADALQPGETIVIPVTQDEHIQSMASAE